MLVVVKKPHTEFSLSGKIPEKYIQMIKRYFGADVVIEDNINEEEGELATDAEWFKEIKAQETPGDNLRFYRRLLKMTQPQLAKKLDTTKQKISNMETGIIPRSEE